VLATLKELQLATRDVLFRFFTLCSARVSTLVIVFSDSPLERIEKLETCPIVRSRLAGESVTKTATLLALSRATVSKVMSAYTNHGKTTSAKRNTGQQSTLTERHHRTLRGIVSKNRRPTAAQVRGQ
jgi:hypothetical protein